MNLGQSVAANFAICNQYWVNAIKLYGLFNNAKCSPTELSAKYSGNTNVTSEPNKKFSSFAALS